MPTRRSWNRGARAAGVALVVAAGGACGDAAPSDLAAPIVDGTLTVVDAPRAPDGVRELDAPPSAVGVTWGGELVAAIDGGLVQSTEAGLAPLPFFSDAPGEAEPARDVIAIAPRRRGGAWILAANGLYRTEGGFHVRVDPSIVGGVGADLVVAPPFDGLWIATSTSLLRLTDAAIFTYELPGAAGTRDLEAADDGSGLVWAGESGVRTLRLAPDGRVEARPAAGELDHPWAVAEDAGRWWVAAGALYASADPEAGWTRYPTSEPVLSIGRGPDGRLWFTSADELYALEAGQDAVAEKLYGAVRAEPLSATRFAPSGDVWVVRGAQALRWRPEAAPPTFEADVRPWLEATGCVDCHAGPAIDFRDYDDFRGVAADALARVESGDMPRCGNEVCGPEGRLAPDAYRVLETWLQTGMNER
jgi:hypothetical protein